MLNHAERREVGELVGKAITELCNALSVIRKAQERIVNGSVDVTAEYHLKDAIQSANNACLAVSKNN